MAFSRNDFIGSFADENVEFNVRVVKNVVLGENYWKVMIFLENGRYIDASSELWQPVPGGNGIKAVAVNADNFAEFMKDPANTLSVWLADLFSNGFSGDCILVACGETIDTSAISDLGLADTVATKADLPASVGTTGIETGTKYGVTSDEDNDGKETYYTATVTDDAIEWTFGGVLPSLNTFKVELGAAYALMKAYAYHKTVLAGEVDGVLDPQIALKLAQLCAGDYKLLSGAPYYPFTSPTPATPTSDDIYRVIANADKSVDAFMCASQLAGHNGALVSLGIALGYVNGSGTPVGNSIDMTSTDTFIPSGPDGTDLGVATKLALNAANVQYFKYVGDGTNENVAAEGGMTVKGDVMQAIWIVSYISYMVKCNVAKLITGVHNFLKDGLGYSRIIETMRGEVAKFGPSGSRRLENILITAPAFNDLPAADGDTIVVPDAWSAWYVDQVRHVKINGTLYIGG